MNSSLIRLFPPQNRVLWKQAAEEPRLWEIRLRAGKPVILHGAWGERFLSPDGRLVDGPGTTEAEAGASRALYCCSVDEIAAILQYICQFSPYAFEEELRRGFVSAAGGHRIGVTGQVVAEGDHIQTIKHISGLNIRVAHQVIGAADQVLAQIYEAGEVQNTLIISPPGCGKTTLLRDLIRQVSDGNPYGEGRRVGVVDERSELAGCYLGIPQNDMGIRTDVLDACPKSIGMMMLLRSMSPQVIAVDEIGGSRDAAALFEAASCGSRLLATVHGTSVEEMEQKSGMESLFRDRIFKRFLILGRRNGVPFVREIRKERAAEAVG